jgi:NADPH-dependent curcumin reductase CurA
VKGREVRLVKRPVGLPADDCFAVEDVDLPEPTDGQVIVRNRYMSVDPYMRGRMTDAKSYVPPYELGKAMEGGAVGEVVASGDPGLAVGDTVLHGLGWRDLALAPAKSARKVDPVEGLQESAFLGVLGTTGLTAYVGLLDIAEMKEGDTVFVSGAAGAVGSVAGQIAKARGASRVVGSAGTPAKVAWLLENGFDAAFDYHDGPVRKLLKQAAPDGIDVYFDNVGGEHLEAAIGAAKPFARMALCGAISAYNATEPPAGPNNLALAVGKRLTLRGFIVTDHGRRMKEFLQEMAGWLRDGTVHTEETVVEGLENATEAFRGVLTGENLGKMIVRI